MKKYLFVIIIAIIYIMFAVFSSNIFNNDTYLFVGEKAKWQYKNGQWSNMETIPQKLGTFNIYNIATGDSSKKMNLYYANNKLISKNKESFNDGFYIMYKGKEDFNVLSFKRRYDVSSKEISEIKKNMGIKNSDIPSAAKIVLDIDNDGTDETIYEVYNSLNYDPDVNKYYSLVCIKDGNKYIKLAYKTDNYIFYDNYVLSSIVDFTNDGDYEIIIGESGISFDAKDTSYTMYGLIDDEYVKLVSTE